MKSHQMPCIIYADIEFLVKKIDGSTRNRENCSTTKIGKHIPCGYLVLTFWAFHHVENKHTLYHRKDSTNNFCSSLTLL